MIKIWEHLQSAQLSTIELPWLTTYFCVYLLCTDSFLHYTNAIFNDLYWHMNSKQRVEYRQYLISTIHASISTSLASISIFYLCAPGQTIFNSHECLVTPRNLHIYVIAHSCAYFIVDASLSCFLRQSFTKVDFQMYAHHALSCIGLLTCRALGGFAPVIGVALLFIEVSTIFVNIRWFLYQHGLDRLMIAQMNTVCGAVVFLFGRVTF